MTLDGNGRVLVSLGLSHARTVQEWVDVVDINGAGKLFQKEENDDTGIGLNTVRKGKIGVKSLLAEYG